MIIYWRTAFYGGLLSILFIAEIVRKYLSGSNAILIIGELTVILIGAYLFFRGRAKATEGIVALVGIYLLWGFVTVTVNDNSFALGAVGSRSVLVPVSALIVSVYVYAKVGLTAGDRIVYVFSSFWLYTAGIVAVSQLVLGPSHFVSLGFAFEDFERVKVAQYDAIGVGSIANFFRPMSIFLATGKFGKVAFILAAFMLYYRAAYNWSQGSNAALVAIELSVLVISGARGGIAGYLILLLFLYADRRFFVRFAAVGIAFGLVGGLTAIVNAQALSVMFARALSVVGDLGSRTQTNFVDPFIEVLERFWAFGAGMGSFSLGSLSYGGMPLYYVVDTGQSENGFLRVLAEVGVVGIILYLLVFLYIVLRPYFDVSTLSGRSSVLKGLYLRFISVTLGVVFLWSLTHDLFGHVLMLSLLFTYLGRSFHRDVRPAQLLFYRV